MRLGHCFYSFIVWFSEDCLRSVFLWINKDFYFTFGLVSVYWTFQEAEEERSLNLFISLYQFAQSRGGGSGTSFRLAAVAPVRYTLADSFSVLLNTFQRANKLEISPKCDFEVFRVAGVN